MDIDVNEEIFTRVEDLEAENYHLTQQVKQLKFASEKDKKLHRKFVDDVVQSEEIRNTEFKNEKKELVEDKKRLIAENRQLTKDKLFYQSAHESLVEEDRNSTSNNGNKASSSTLEQTSPSAPRSRKRSVSIPTNLKPTDKPTHLPNRNTKKNSKTTAKIFEDNKKLKLKNTRLTRDNASLRSKVKQLENINQKIQKKKPQYDDDQKELHDLFASSRLTNEQRYTPEVLAKLGELSRD